ncbi:conserved hypothetical protein [Desulfamplus magnetovallimortis]|uniref:SiaC family regulatory phosphoprotein domain-containing protein n=1 Tax=Desulfamplus magnetovallimortis TaxID=1246637 RepID=A0A1W1H794_9BACT|nr:DUF1987 domain-containing protein [Desulfamplus magnetovallimortis]SLM28304.1 conserved hypothetical protein [Desulfamplus magnetovallimortis]
MENIKISPTERTPEISFDFEKNIFSITGESYPENVNDFYDDIMGKLKQHLGQLSDSSVEMNFELIYFNSSTAKVLMELFDLMEETAENGNSVIVNWIYEEDDDHMEELGEEFGEDLDSAQFNMKIK